MPPPAVGGSVVAARALGIVLRLPGEVLPDTADREPGVAEPEEVDPIAPVFVVGVDEDAALRVVTVADDGVVAAEPLDVVVPAAPL